MVARLSSVPAVHAEMLVMQDRCDGHCVTACVEGRAVVHNFRSGLTSLLLLRDVADGGPVRTAWVIL